MTFDENTFEDKDNDTLNISFRLKDGHTLPGDFNFDSQTMTLTGTFESLTAEKPFFL